MAILMKFANAVWSYSSSKLSQMSIAPDFPGELQKIDGKSDRSFAQAAVIERVLPIANFATNSRSSWHAKA
jgi:hypothetical protein